MDTRRRFLQASAAAAVVSKTVLGANDRIQMGIIGTGGRGMQVQASFAKHQDCAFIAACDVAKDRLDQAVQKIGGKVDAYGDYRRILDRKDIDAVLITTPDHWHAPMMTAACDVGKDVYVEKPVSNTLEGSQQMLAAAQKTRRIVQVGCQQRSWPHFQEAAKMLGMIGQVTHIVLRFPASYTSVQQPPQDPPAGLDWAGWLGPAPKKPYSPGRQRGWRAFYDYGGGILTDWGVHLTDVAHWYMNSDTKGPLETFTSAQWIRVQPPDVEQLPDSLSVVWKYDRFVMSFDNAPSDFSAYGNYYHGTNGVLMVNRMGYYVRPTAGLSLPGRAAAKPPFEAKEYSNPEGISEDPNSAFASATVLHARNFLDCVKSRQKPACDMETGFYSTLPCLVALMSIRQARALAWDGKSVRPL